MTGDLGAPALAEGDNDAGFSHTHSWAPGGRSGQHAQSQIFCVCAGRLLDERDFHPPALAEGDSDAGFSQMPFDTQLGTQGGTQANLLTRFGAVDVPARRGPAGETTSWTTCCSAGMSFVTAQAVLLMHCKERT